MSLDSRTKSKNTFTSQNNLSYNHTMAKKVMVNVERVKPKTKIVMVKLEKVKQPKQPKDVSTHFKFKKVTEWANKQILARFKFKKVAKGENIKLKLVKKSKNN